VQLPSIVSTLNFESRRIYVKRDDLIDPLLSGNKFRKLYTLYNTPSNRYHTIISYGGTQSNAMLSIAALCKQKKWRFIYHTKTLSKHIDEGNFTLAVDLGMQVVEHSHENYREAIEQLHFDRVEGTYLLAQGGADALAGEGVEVLAKEIQAFKKEQNIEHLNIVTPSGTGTTAYFLAKFLREDSVCTTPSIGTKAYLQEQMQFLGALPSNLHILESQKHYHFAKPYKELYLQYQELLAEGIEFDLLYAAKMFVTLKENLENIEGDIMYVHSGGVLGNKSMLKRYSYKNLI